MLSSCVRVTERLNNDTPWLKKENEDSASSLRMGMGYLQCMETPGTVMFTVTFLSSSAQQPLTTGKYLSCVLQTIAHPNTHNLFNCAS